MLFFFFMNAIIIYLVIYYCRKYETNRHIDMLGQLEIKTNDVLYCY